MKALILFLGDAKTPQHVHDLPGGLWFFANKYSPSVHRDGPMVSLSVEGKRNYARLRERIGL